MSFQTLLFIWRPHFQWRKKALLRKEDSGNNSLFRMTYTSNISDSHGYNKTDKVARGGETMNLFVLQNWNGN
jgi:hypothetical protein